MDSQVSSRRLQSSSFAMTAFRRRWRILGEGENARETYVEWSWEFCDRLLDDFSNRAGKRHFRTIHAASLHPNDLDGGLHCRDDSGYSWQFDGNFDSYFITVLVTVAYSRYSIAFIAYDRFTIADSTRLTICRRIRTSANAWSKLTCEWQHRMSRRKTPFLILIIASFGEGMWDLLEGSLLRQIRCSFQVETRFLFGLYANKDFGKVNFSFAIFDK